MQQRPRTDGFAFQCSTLFSCHKSQPVLVYYSSQANVKMLKTITHQPWHRFSADIRNSLEPVYRVTWGMMGLNCFLFIYLKLLTC